MTKYHGSNKLKTAVFISGNGSNFKNLFKFSLSKSSPILINLVMGVFYAEKKSSVLQRFIIIFFKKQKVIIMQ